MKRPRFLVDTMLGRLAKWLRILGFDTKFLKVSQRKRMLEKSFLERRILITREAKLANAHAYRLIVLREQHWWNQLTQVWKTLELAKVPANKIFSRCTECNEPIRKISKESLNVKKIPPKVLERHKNFYQCANCHKILWPGSHLENTLKRLKELGDFFNGS